VAINTTTALILSNYLASKTAPFLVMFQLRKVTWGGNIGIYPKNIAYPALLIEDLIILDYPAFSSEVLVPQGNLLPRSYFL